ncbi:MAG: ATP-binding cassette domain-containing protein [Dehalobacterium sp.]|jgi:ABC-type sugar transport system ATPase subunit
MIDEEYFLEVHDVVKRFGHVTALDGVSLKAALGEILAIVGDNGAGKSTLIKILTGVLVPDRGRIVIDGKSYLALTPKIALEAGISTVYQDLALANSRDVATNIFLGRELTKRGFLDNKKMYAEAEELIRNLGIAIPDVRMPVEVLSGGQRQGTAVARAVHQGGKFFIFDEPTAAMGLTESATVIKLIKNLAQQGYGVIIISHNLPQVFEISDRICVMRHGRIVGKVKTTETDMEDIVAMITGAVNKS